MRWISSLLILFSTTLMAQNLVQNPSFEEHTFCNAPLGPVNLAVHWSNIANSTGSPNYFNSCSTDVAWGVPANTMGYQAAVDGQAYIGLATFSISTPGFREYAQSQLSSPMIAGQEYAISFFVSAAENMKLVSNNIGITFSVAPLVGDGSNQPVLVEPALESTVILSSPDDWTEISGNYVAIGGENYLTLGNFRNDEQTAYEILNPNIPTIHAFYYIDSVSVTPVLKNHESEFKSITLFPNPANDRVHINLPEHQMPASVRLVSIVGTAWTLPVQDGSADISNLPPGVYFVFLTADSRQVVKRLIKV